MSVSRNFVGWVERSETHPSSEALLMAMGFAFDQTHPAFSTSRFRVRA